MLFRSARMCVCVCARMCACARVCALISTVAQAHSCMGIGKGCSSVQWPATSQQQEQGAGNSQACTTERWTAPATAAATATAATGAAVSRSCGNGRTCLSKVAAENSMLLNSRTLSSVAAATTSTLWTGFLTVRSHACAFACAFSCAYVLLRAHV